MKETHISSPSVTAFPDVMIEGRFVCRMVGEYTIEDVYWGVQPDENNDEWSVYERHVSIGSHMLGTWGFAQCLTAPLGDDMDWMPFDWSDC